MPTRSVLKVQAAKRVSDAEGGIQNRPGQRLILASPLGSPPEKMTQVMPAAPSAPPCDFCALWKGYARHGGHHYDDAAHAPWPWRDGAPPRGAPWRNIVPARPSLEALAAAANLEPATRCASLGLRASPEFDGRGRRLSWLHVPKAGSSFGLTIYRSGCPRIPADVYVDDGAPIVSLTERFPRRRRRWCNRDAFSGNLNGHEPLRYPQHRGRTIALFRQPARRLASECAALQNEFRRAFGESAAAAAPHVVCGGQGGLCVWRNGTVYANSFLREFLYSHGLSHAAIASLTELWNRPGRLIPLAACAALPGMLGCQTKMVLGVPCAAPFALNASHLREAIRRVRFDFAFVGLTERFDASVCLFHSRFGGAPVAAQFLNTRPRGIGVAGAPSLGLDETLPADEWDDALYLAAQARFEKDRAAATLSVSQPGQ